MNKITTFIKTMLMVAAILFTANSTKAVVTMEYDGTTYLCDMNIEGNTIYIENCIGIIGNIDVIGEAGGGDEGGGGGGTPVPEPSYPSSGGGGGTSTNNLNNVKVDFRSLTDRQRLETILNALKNNSCILSNLFSYFPTVSYTSPPEGTIVNMCGESYKIVLTVGSFSDDFAGYGAITPNIGYFNNIYGCWEPINIGNNSTMRILVSCENGNFDSFYDCIFR